MGLRKEKEDQEVLLRHCGRKRSAAIPFRITRIEFVDATPYKQWAMKVDRKPPITNQQENSHVLKLIEGDASATKPKTSKMLSESEVAQK